MKKIIILSVIFLSFLSNSALALNYVQTISSSYQINGRAYTYRDNAYFDVYNDSVSFPITGSASVFGPGIANAKSITGLYAASVYAYAYGRDESYNDYLSYANAIVSWTFQPISNINNLSVYRYGGGYSSATFTLTDALGGSLPGSWNMVDISCPRPPDILQPNLAGGITPMLLYEYDFSSILYSGQTYVLNFNVHADADWDEYYAGLWTNISVPEPATMLLLGLGLMGLAGIRRKIKK